MYNPLPAGVDFRLPQYRREVFLRFYEFHLKYKSHPGGVYMFIPYLMKYFDWDIEQTLWFATLNGMTQYPMTSLAIMNECPYPPASGYSREEFQKWFDAHWANLPFDVDRKYQKRECPKAIFRVADLLEKYGSLKALYTGDFDTLWQRMRKELWSLGRLGAWSGLEFIKIAGRGYLDFEFNSLMLRDRDGSKSHRNGLCRVLGRDDLDWHDKLNPDFDGKYSVAQYEWLEEEGVRLLEEARERFEGREYIGDVGYETLESTLCCYKSWHRPNRRYPSVYNDLAYGRLLETSEKNPGLNLSPFWEARVKYLPDWLRIEAQPEHPQYGKKSLDKGKQNIYLETGRIHTMGWEWEEFEK